MEVLCVSSGACNGPTAVNTLDTWTLQKGKTPCRTGAFDRSATQVQSGPHLIPIVIFQRTISAFRCHQLRPIGALSPSKRGDL